MSKLNQSPSLDGVRDVMFPDAEASSVSSGSTESNVALGSDKVRFRMPIHGGSSIAAGSGIEQPWTYDTTSASYVRRTDYPHRVNDAVQMSDLRYMFRLHPELKSYTSTSTKSSTTRAFRGWCTQAAMYALSGTTSTSRTAQGKGVSNGDNHYNSSQVMPFDSINSSHDGNKWLSGFITKAETSGGIFGTTTYTTYVIFEGQGASTTDTDWNTITLKTYDNSTGSFNMANATSPQGPTQMTYSGGGYYISVDQDLHRSDATVTFSNSRVVYTWSNQGILDAMVQTISIKGTDFTNTENTNQIIKFF